MKIQGLAIIFILIILPIIIVLGEYVYAQTETIKLEQLYDSNLINATHDAIKAFQINTFNDASSDIADSKIESLEASVNAFYNSMEASFGMQGYSKETLQTFIPALVYTMYDGYYIYSPYTNIADTSSGTGVLNVDLNSNNRQHGFKPYVYYSCRYIKNDIDVIINYTLDNYITVQGTIGGTPVNGTGTYSGYLLTLARTKDDEGVYYDSINDKYYYSGIEIIEESSLTDYLVEQSANGSVTKKQYRYIKLNGTKYYWNEAEESIFYISGANRIEQIKKSANEDTYNKYIEQIRTNTSGIQYYKEAYMFSNWVQSNLGRLTTENAVGDGIKAASGTGIKIFENTQIEYSSSNFNLHRKEVIKYSIESNLSVAIANFNSYTSAGTNFQMPKLKATEWEMLQNEVSLISFLQGLNIGGKVYNGYTVVNNSKTEEFVSEEDIYITDDEYYHRINDNCLVDPNVVDSIVNNTRETNAVLNLDYEIRKDVATGTYYTQKLGTGCYGSIIDQGNVNNSYDSVYEYLWKSGMDDRIKQMYYVALGRERWGTYKIENSSNISTILAKMDNTIAPSIPSIPDVPEIITASEVTSLDYGAYVTNYEASNASNANLGIGGWRIFHSDGTNIYLIADNYVKTNYIPAGKDGTTIINSTTAQRGFSLAPYLDYNGWNAISSTMSWKWLKQYYSLPSGYNAWHYSNSQKATAYLLDTNVWTGFKDNNGYASYAMGAPSLELFVASYNKTHTSKTIDITVTSAGYHAKWSTDASYSSIVPYGNTISSGIFLSGMDTSDSLYVINSEVNAVGMWLASPSSRDDNAMMTIGAAGTIVSMSKELLSEGARPIVCLNSSVQLEKLPNGNYQIVNRDGAF